MTVQRLLSFKSSRPSQIFWFCLSLTVAALYALLVLQDAFRTPYTVQDDARQHVFWMRRFLDPTLFPNDLIADYFESVAPWGYTQLYRLLAISGIDPLVANKLLPPLLGLTATAYGFGVTLQLLPVPFAGFLAALMLNQVFWSHDDITSATPRAFMVPLFLAFLYYLLRRNLWGVVAAIALEGLFYPQYVFVFAGILLLQLVSWDAVPGQGRRFQVSTKRADLLLSGAGLLVAFVVLLPYALIDNPYGPVLTVAEAKTIPEFFTEGRGRFFLTDPWLFWLSGNRSGVFPTFKPPLMGLAIALPWLWRYPARFPLVQQTRNLGLLLRIVAVAFGLFFAAHALLFKLHLPSRYTGYTLRFVWVFAAAIALTVLLDAGLRWLTAAAGSPHPKSLSLEERDFESSSPSPSGRRGWGMRANLHRGIPRWLRQITVGGLAAIVAAALLLYPLYIGDFPADEYRVGRSPQLYEFFAQQPKNILIASLLDEADFLPTFSNRSILFGREYAIPYHKAYGAAIRQRANALIRAQYTTNPAELTRFLQTYSVDFWLISRNAFRPAALNGLNLRQYPAAVAAAQAQLQQGTPVLATLINQCTDFQSGALVVLNADCIQRAVNVP